MKKIDGIIDNPIITFITGVMAFLLTDFLIGKLIPGIDTFVKLICSIIVSLLILTVVGSALIQD